MVPDYHALAAFHAVAELCSFREASERMGVTRSAVSQAVRRLEERLGVALFQRTTRSVVLTEEGTALFERLAQRCRISLWRWRSRPIAKTGPAVCSSWRCRPLPTVSCPVPIWRAS
ncbi:LysR family transcriptional regulator [Brevundimonas sp. GN22]